MGSRHERRTGDPAPLSGVFIYKKKFGKLIKAFHWSSLKTTETISVPKFLLDTCSSRDITSFNIHKAKKGILRGRNITYTAYQLFSVTEKRQRSFMRSWVSFSHTLPRHLARIDADVSIVCIFQALLVKMSRCPGRSTPSIIRWSESHFSKPGFKTKLSEWLWTNTELTARELALWNTSRPNAIGKAQCKAVHTQQELSRKPQWLVVTPLWSAARFISFKFIDFLFISAAHIRKTVVGRDPERKI